MTDRTTELLAERKDARDRAELADRQIAELASVAGFNIEKAAPANEWDAIELSAAWIADVMDALRRMDPENPEVGTVGRREIWDAADIPHRPRRLEALERLFKKAGVRVIKHYSDVLSDD